MFKNQGWILEIVIVTLFFGLTSLVISSIRIHDYRTLISGQAINALAYIIFLPYVIYKIIKTENNDHPFRAILGNRLEGKDIWLILLLSQFMAISSNLMVKIDWIHVFDRIPVYDKFHLSGFQSWSLILLLLVFIPVGVFAEELFFRGYLFKVQFLSFKNYTWIINGFSWSIWHIFFTSNFLAILPGCLLYSYIYQRRRNLWVTISAHMIYNMMVFSQYSKFIYKLTS